MQYIEVATLRAKILHQVRTGEAVDVIEQTLREYSDAVWHNGRAHAHNEDFRPNHDPQRNRAELIQLTAGALSGAISSDQVEGPSDKLAAFAVQCAEAALKIINKKQQP